VPRSSARRRRALDISRFDLKDGNLGLPQEQVARTIELYGTEVIPRGSCSAIPSSHRTSSKRPVAEPPGGDSRVEPIKPKQNNSWSTYPTLHLGLHLNYRTPHVQHLPL
jgi:hypothetical protein